MPDRTTRRRAQSPELSTRTLLVILVAGGCGVLAARYPTMVTPVVIALAVFGVLDRLVR